MAREHEQSTATPGLFHDKHSDLVFALVVGDFGVKHTNQDDAQRLLQTLEAEHKVSTDWSGTHCCGLNTLNDLGHPQPPTTLVADNSTASGIANDTVKQRRSKAVDMRCHRGTCLRGLETPGGSIQKGSLSLSPSVCVCP